MDSGVGIGGDLHSITQNRFDLCGCKGDDPRARNDHHRWRRPGGDTMPGETFRLSRRAALTGAGATILSAPALAQQRQEAALGSPPSVISNPPRQWGRFAPPNIYPDPDIIVVDPAFKRLLLGITAI